MNFGAMMRAFDALMMMRDAARSLMKGDGDPPPSTSVARPAPPPSHALGAQLETTLTNVVVAALKEAFDRDHARLELERNQLEEQRRRADQALRLELRRQAAERELGRLRLLGGTALVGWVASVVAIGIRVSGVSTAGRVVVAIGWVLLLGAVAAAFSAQGRVIAYVPDGDRALDAGHVGTASLWLLVAGLGAIAMSLLL
jgi:hypothetical protein